jgi:hypothetical protein
MPRPAPDRRLPARLLASSAFLLLAFPLPAEEPKPAPRVYELDMAGWDAAALAAGDWVEHEMAGPAWPQVGTKRPVRRLACVGVEGDVAWVEVTYRNAPAALDGMVLALAVRRTDRKVARAYWGKPGGEATEVKVQPGSPGASGPGVVKPTCTGSGKVAKEKTKAAGATLDCEKVELETHLTSSCCDERVRTTTWVCDKVPFRAWIEEAPQVGGVTAAVTWEGKPAVKGGVAKRTVFANNQLTTETLLKHGTDAKETLSRPKPK